VVRRTDPLLPSNRADRSTTLRTWRSCNSLTYQTRPRTTRQNTNSNWWWDASSSHLTCKLPSLAWVTHVTRAPLWKSSHLKLYNIALKNHPRSLEFHLPQMPLTLKRCKQTIIVVRETTTASFRLTFTANVKPLTKFLILQLYYNSFYTSFEIY
jgi:hypothetical protein